MKKSFIIGVVFLLMLLLMAQFFFAANERSNNIYNEEVVLDEVSTTTPVEVEEVISDTVSTAVAPPEEVATAAVPLAPPQPQCVVIEDFTNDSSRLSWFVVNDGVMGGLSQGSVVITDDALLHTGVINTNGGGFSSVRARLPAEVLVGYSRLQIRLNTFGRQYAVNFGDARYRSVSHQALLTPSLGDEWQEVFVDFSQTIPTSIGFRVDTEPFAASAIEELNLILSDGADGPFQMEVEWIKACL